MNFIENENKILEVLSQEGLDKDFYFGRMELLKPTVPLGFAGTAVFFYV